MISFRFKMEYIVDVQGFKGCNEKEFIFKKVAIISLEEDATPSVFLFQPPLSWSYLSAKQKSENIWLENNYLGMLWSSGEIPYEQVPDILNNVLTNAVKIYVKGVQKRESGSGIYFLISMHIITYSIYLFITQFTN